MESGNESGNFVRVAVTSTPKTETATNVAPLIEEVGATSIPEIEKLMGELQEAKNFLQSERERIQRETARYINLTQVASAAIKLISDTVSQWCEAGHPIGDQPRVREFEITHSPIEDSTG